jgi:thiamine biosynthesis lipoprotein
MPSFVPTADGRGVAAETFRAMGSDVEVVVVGGSAHHLGLARELIDGIEQRWSRFLPSSDISRINAANGADVVVDRSTVALVAAMVQGWVASGGAFDPSLLGPLVELGYAASQYDPSLVTELAPGAAPRTQMTDVLLDPATCVVRAPAGTTLDAGGVGKGLAADLVVNALIDAGAAGALVGVGGDVRVSGIPPQPGGWRIGLVDVVTGREQAQVTLAEGGVATSGTSHRVWNDARGRPVHHLLDPGTGAPLAAAGRHVVEATVVAGTAVWAEVFTKVLLVRGPQTALAELDDRGLGGRVRWSDGRAQHNRSWEAMVSRHPEEGT